MRDLGIVFSSRLQSFLLGLLGLWVLFVIGGMAWQIVTAYVAGEGFDATVGEVWAITLMFYVPYFFATAYMLRSLTARIALYRLLRKQIVIAEYQPPKVLLPVECGVLVDDAFSLGEVAGTLKDLELRGYLQIVESDAAMDITLRNREGLSIPETVFINHLFPRGQAHFATNDPDGPARLLAAGRALASSTKHELIYKGQRPASPRYQKSLRSVFKIFIGFALFVQAALTIGFVTAPEQILGINHPRFPMHISEPILVLAMLVGSLLFIASGFWVRSLTDIHGLKNWRYVAGLKLYLEKVYKGRFYRDGRLTVSERELRTFYPYALALGVERDFTSRLERKLIRPARMGKTRD